jgi:hypothetical protein
MMFGNQYQWGKATKGSNLHSAKRNNPQPQGASSLVPLERFHSVSRRQFILGLLLGVAVSLSATIPAFRYANRRPHTAASASARFGQTVSSNSITDTEKRPAYVPFAASNPTISNSTIGVRKETPQHPVRPSPLAANFKGDASFPAHSQTTALVSANQPESVPSSSRLHGIGATPGDGTEHPAKTAATPQELWSQVQAGNINAALTLADLYARGDGVTANCTQARILLQLASKKRSAEAARRLQKLDTSGCAASPDEESKPN